MCGGVRGSGHGCRAGWPPLSSVEDPDIVLSQLRWLRAGVNAAPCDASAPRRVRYLNKKGKSIPTSAGSAATAFRRWGVGRRRVCQRSWSPAGATHVCTLRDHPHLSPRREARPWDTARPVAGAAHGRRLPVLPGVLAEGMPGRPRCPRAAIRVKGRAVQTAATAFIHYPAYIHRQLRRMWYAVLPVCPYTAPGYVCAYTRLQIYIYI